MFFSQKEDFLNGGMMNPEIIFYEFRGSYLVFLTDVVKTGGKDIGIHTGYFKVGIPDVKAGIERKFFGFCFC